MIKRSSLRLKRQQPDQISENEKEVTPIKKSKKRLNYGTDTDNNDLESSTSNHCNSIHLLAPQNKIRNDSSELQICSENSEEGKEVVLEEEDDDEEDETLYTPTKGNLGTLQKKKSYLSKTELQTELTRQRGSIWSMLLEPDSAGILEAVRKDPSVLMQRDAVNATPLLLLCLYHKPEHIQLFNTIVQTPMGAARVGDAYGEGPYEGETCLHLAIVHRNLDLAFDLIRLHHALISMKTIGIFFARAGTVLKKDGGDENEKAANEDRNGTGSDSSDGSNEESSGRCYFGGYPLSFAVATNNGAMVRMLLDNRANIEAVDEEGNNALHMAVLSGTMAMFTLLEDELQQRKRKLQVEAEMLRTISASSTCSTSPSSPCSPSSPKFLQKKKSSNKVIYPLERKESDRGIVLKDMVPLSFRKNNEGYNCFELAAAYGTSETFECLLDSLRVKQWDYGPVSCVVYPLSPLEEALTVLMDTHRLDLLTASGRMKDLVNRKWNTFARRLFNWRLIRFVVCLVAFQLAIFIDPSRKLFKTSLYSINEPLDDLNQHDVTVVNDVFSMLSLMDPIKTCQLFCELFVFVAALLKFSTEFGELLEFGLSAHFLRPRGALFLENIISMTACLSAFAIALCRLLFFDILYFVLLHNHYIVERVTSSPTLYTVELLFTVLAALSLWAYCLWFMLGFKRTGPFVIMISEIIIKDALPFVCIFSVFLGCFSTCFWLLDDDQQGGGGAGLLVHLQRCLAAILGAVNLEDYSGVGVESSEESVLYGLRSTIELLLVGFYLTLVSIVLLNMLIAKMGDTYNHVTENADRKWLMEWARVVQSIEREMSKEELEIQKYWVGGSDSDEKFLQIEEYDKDIYLRPPP